MTSVYHTAPEFSVKNTTQLRGAFILPPISDIKFLSKTIRFGSGGKRRERCLDVFKIKHLRVAVVGRIQGFEGRIGVQHMYASFPIVVLYGVRGDPQSTFARKGANFYPRILFHLTGYLFAFSRLDIQFPPEQVDCAEGRTQGLIAVRRR